MRLITQNKAAKLALVSERTIARWRQNGELAFYPGKPVRIELLDLLDFLERKKQCPYKKERSRISLTEAGTMKSSTPKTCLTEDQEQKLRAQARHRGWLRKST